MSERGSRGPVVVVTLAAVLLAALVAAFIAGLEEVERVARTPPRGEAHRNPVLAAERLLGAMGVDAVSTARLGELPPPDHVLILASENRVLTRARADRLIGWVTEGGYLIVGPYLKRGDPAPQTWNDPLLEALDVSVIEYEADPERERLETLEMEAFVGDEIYRVDFRSDFALTVASDSDDEAGHYALVWNDLGDGLFVVLNDLGFLHSDAIGKNDHARFLWDLVEFGEGRRGAVLVHGWGFDSLWTLLVRHAWPALLPGAVLLAAWLWRHAARFGPRIPPAPHGSRALLEHVDGLGWFLWRSGRGDALVDSTRRALERRILARRPGFVSMDRRQRVAALAVGSDLAEDAIEEAAFGANPHHREAFTRTIRTLEHLRREL